MKKILVAIIAIVLVMALFGCGGDKSAPEEEPAATDAVEMETEEAEPADTAEETTDGDSSTDSGVLSPEFKKTMDDYEAWFDHYCEVMKKYKENPTDLNLMSEVTDLLSEETTMLEQMENMDESEMNSAELAYYIEVTARIEKKLLEVADY